MHAEARPTKFSREAPADLNSFRRSSKPKGLRSKAGLGNSLHASVNAALPDLVSHVTCLHMQLD